MVGEDSGDVADSAIPPDPASGRSRDPALADLAEAAAVERDLSARLRRLTEDMAVQMRLARSRGSTWQDIAEAVGMKDGETARSWAKYQAPPNPPPSGVTIAEASRRLGVSRPTVYARIKAGELRTVLDPQGRTRVLLDTE